MALKSGDICLFITEGIHNPVEMVRIINIKADSYCGAYVTSLQDNPQAPVFYCREQRLFKIEDLTLLEKAIYDIK